MISTLAPMLVGGNETSRKLVGNAIALDMSADHLEWEASAMHRSPEEVPIRFTPT